MALKILIDGFIRDMTPEEEADFLAAVEEDDATESDYIDALNTLGVDTNEEN